MRGLMRALVKVFECRPITNGVSRSGAGVRKPARDETADCTGEAVPQAQLWREPFCRRNESDELRRLPGNAGNPSASRLELAGLAAVLAVCQRQRSHRYRGD